MFNHNTTIIYGILFIITNIGTFYWNISTFEHENTLKARKISDPISLTSEDSFGFSDSIKKYIPIMLENTDKRSYGSIIMSPWGTGKTSFCNLIQDNMTHIDKDLLKTYRISKALYIYIDVSKYNTFENILTMITERIYEKINKYFILPLCLKSYLKKVLLNIFSSNVQLPAADIFSLNTDTANELTYLNNILNIYKIRLIIIFDEVDRLDKKQSRHVFNMYKYLNRNIKNTSIIFTTTEEHFQDLITDIYPYVVENCNDEIINKYFDNTMILPIISDNHIIMLGNEYGIV